MRQKTLATLVIGFTLLVLGPNWASGQNVQPKEIFTIDQAADLKNLPTSFCVTDEEIFLLPDAQSREIKLFEKSGEDLKFLNALGGSGFGEETFGKITFFNYNRYKDQLVLMDDTARKLIILKRKGLIDFIPYKTFNCKFLGYDMDFAEDLNRLVISGYVTDKEGNPFDLYSISIKTGQIEYLLPSQEKYGMKTREDYEEEYFKKLTLPAIGINAYFDIYGDKLFFVWEGSIRIIKLDLNTKEKTTFGQETTDFVKPDSYKLVSSYLRKDDKITLNERAKRAYVKNIFATPGFVFLIYEIPTTSDNASPLRLQAYTFEGKYLSDVVIPLNGKQKPGRTMWLNKISNELYVFSAAEESSNTASFSLLKYKIINR